MNQFSRIGFILAAAGSAVGLGNIWRFPYVTGEYGGGAFVLTYLLCIIFVGLVAFLAETIIGQYSQSNVSASFAKMAKSKNKNWAYAGFIMITPMLVLSFYSVVLGWVLSYFIASFSNLPATTEEAVSIFNNLISNDVGILLVYHTAIASCVVFIILKGIIEGIEKANLILMPLLGLILFMLLGYTLSLDSFPKAISFMFNPDFGKLNSEGLLAALGQAFFTLSLGTGSIMTYAASLPKDNNIVKSTLSIGIIDTSIAIIAGIIIFSFLFEAGAQSSGGPGLVFISLPVIFAKWGIVGTFISILFFIALLFAGITSAISMLEPSIKFFIEKFNFTRKKAVMLTGLTFYILGFFAILSMSKTYGENLTFFGKNLFDIFDYLTASYLMPIGSFIICIFIGYFVDKNLVEKIFEKHSHFKIFKLWYFLIKIIAPIAIIIIFLNQLGFIR